LRWWRELAIIAAFYGLYTGARDVHGSNVDATRQATTNAHRIIHLERSLHLFHEQAVQQTVIHHTLLMRCWDAFYDSAHFIAVAGVLVYLFLRMPDRYRVWRNTLAICTALALLGFAVFPLLPPRLLGAPYHFVDSVDTIGGLFTLRNDTVADLSNLYAAMPSLHTAWSTWCALALMPAVRRRALRPLLLVYPLITVYCIVITANHYFLDAVGGLVVLAVAYPAAGQVSYRYERWQLRRDLDRHPQHLVS
jgi:hypothetical protein